MLFRKLCVMAVAVMLGWAVMLTGTASASLANPPTPDGGGLGAVSCWADGHCMAVGGSGRGVLADVLDGAHWSATRLPIPGVGTPSYSTLRSVSCSADGSCMAVGYDGCGGSLADHWNGHAWRQVSGGLAGCPKRRNTATLDDVSCGSPDSCLAVGGSELVEIWNGARWHGEAGPSVRKQGRVGLAAVDCLTVTRCAFAGRAVVSYNGVVGFWDAGRWSTRALVDNGELGRYGADGPYELACSSALFCLALGDNIGDGDGMDPVSEQVAWNGIRWTVSYPKVSQFLPGSAIACSAGGACVSGGGSGRVLSYSPSDRWTTLVKYRWTVRGLGCPPSGPCVAVGTALSRRGAPIHPKAALLP
jgi:hypothetical protein